jgi:hypothetical protein
VTDRALAASILAAAATLLLLWAFPLLLTVLVLLVIVAVLAGVFITWTGWAADLWEPAGWLLLAVLAFVMVTQLDAALLAVTPVLTAAWSLAGRGFPRQVFPDAVPAQWTEDLL